LMSDINTLYLPVPKPETVIAYNYVNFIVINYPFYPYVLSQYLVKKKRGFQKKKNILRQETGITSFETREINIGQPR
jgi:hypothetical protein